MSYKECQSDGPPKAISELIVELIMELFANEEQATKDGSLGLMRR